MEGKKEDDVGPETEQAWIESLGEHHDEQPIVKLLEESDLLGKLASKLEEEYRRAGDGLLERRHARRPGGDLMTFRVQKFAERAAASAAVRCGGAADTQVYHFVGLKQGQHTSYGYSHANTAGDAGHGHSGCTLLVTQSAHLGRRHGPRGP